jgi:microcystin-dependent protein
MAYTISYTDEANKGTITVEDGTLNTETSLKIPGRNTTSYGAVIAENFLHLLENFANTSEPTNPVEGQLWYDTTGYIDETSGVTDASGTLKVYDGTNWTPASGITKQISTPAKANTGDLWVDTDSQQLYLYTGGGWILVGPQFSEGLTTGATPTTIVGADNVSYPVLLVEVAAETIAIFSNNDPFSPKARINGFTQINPGLNLIDKDTDGDNLSNFKFYGTAEKAEALIVNNSSVAAGNFLRGDTTSTTTFPLNVQNNTGINVGVNAELTVGVEGNVGILQHNISGSSIDVRVRNNDITKTIMRLDSGLKVGINNEAPEKELDVTGSIQSSGTLTVNDTTQSTLYSNGSVIIKGGVGIAKNLNIGGEVKLNSLTTTSSLVAKDHNLYNIGSSTVKYKDVYATTFHGSLEGTVTGRVIGRSTLSDALTSKTKFKITGDVNTIVDVQYDGQFQDPSFDNGFEYVRNADGEIIGTTPLPPGEEPLTKVFRTEISNTFIADKDPMDDLTTRNSDELIVNSIGNGLKKITKANFLASVPRVPTGSIMPYAGPESALPDDWLMCNGQAVDRESYKALFEVIQYTYGPYSTLVNKNTFKVPDLRGRLPLGKDDMGPDGSPRANNVSAESATSLGAVDGSETKVITEANLPDHTHDLRNEDNDQFYALRDIPGTPSEIPLATSDNSDVVFQTLGNSGGIDTSNNLSTPMNIMPPTMTMNYIIYTGREL